MEYYNNILCVEAGWLIDNDVMAIHQYEYLSKTKQICIVRRACKNTPALVSYDSIPRRFKPAIKKALGCDPAEAAKVSQLETRIEHDAEISKIYEEFTLPDGRRLPEKTRLEYYSNAIVLNAIEKLLSDKASYRKARSGRVSHNWDDISDGVQELDRTKYPHTLPANTRRLRDRFNRYKKEGAESLIHKNYMNKNSAKVDDEIKESYITELIAAPNNLDNEQIARLYNTIAGQLGWKMITGSAVAVWRDKLDLTTYAGRRGTSAFSNKKAMQAKRKAPSTPMLYWTLDGWDAELLYQKTGEGATTYHHRPTVVIVLDACLKYPIGYAVGTHETPELIQEALRNAAKHTVKLFGSMQRVHQLQSDRYAVKKMTPYYEALADKYTPAKARNAKSKIIEPYFGEINKKYCQVQANWSGFGITSNPEKQPNNEYLNKYKQFFPDFEGVCKQIEMIIERERAAKVERYIELWHSMEDKKKIAMSPESYLLQFGETTGFTNLLQGSGLHPTIKGQKRAYDCFELSFRDHSSTKWRVMYDPEDLTHVLAVNEDGSLQYILEEKYIQPMALADRIEGDSDQLQRIRNYNKELEGEVIERRAVSGSTVREHMENTGLIENETLKRLLITDSRGQHKNQKSVARTGKMLPVVEVQPAEIEDEEQTYFDRY